MNKKALSTMMAVFLVLAIGAVGYVIGTSSGVTGYAVKKVSIDSENICRFGEKQCGFSKGVTEAPVKNNINMKCYSGDSGISLYPDDKGKSGYTICKEKGYDTCLQMKFKKILEMYESTDGSCQNKQGEQEYYDLRDCGQSIGMYVNQCGTKNGAEPYAGDARLSINGDGTPICCNFE